VIHGSDRLPGIVVMTRFTQVRSVNVRETFTRSTDAIVTAGAGFTRQSVIKHSY
jgi:hypothetical protein